MPCVWKKKSNNKRKYNKKMQMNKIKKKNKNKKKQQQKKQIKRKNKNIKANNNKTVQPATIKVEKNINCFQTVGLDSKFDPRNDLKVNNDLEVRLEYNFKENRQVYKPNIKPFIKKELTTIIKPKSKIIPIVKDNVWSKDNTLNLYKPKPKPIKTTQKLKVVNNRNNSFINRNNNNYRANNFNNNNFINRNNNNHRSNNFNNNNFRSNNKNNRFVHNNNNQNVTSENMTFKDLLSSKHKFKYEKMPDDIVKTVLNQKNIRRDFTDEEYDRIVKELKDNNIHKNKNVFKGSLNVLNENNVTTTLKKVKAIREIHGEELDSFFYSSIIDFVLNLHIDIHCLKEKLANIKLLVQIFLSITSLSKVSSTGYITQLINIISVKKTNMALHDNCDTIIVDEYNEQYVCVRAILFLASLYKDGWEDTTNIKMFKNGLFIACKRAIKLRIKNSFKINNMDVLGRTLHSFCLLHEVSDKKSLFNKVHFEKLLALVEPSKVNRRFIFMIKDIIKLFV